ncbi:MAG: hypothetical protein LBL38_01785 [Lactobacillales bacterium]|jgi:Rgg/GadR/MutR family transcriptional activator|nr:hypothetical protein [Lactobacillales bacterium]
MIQDSFQHLQVKIGEMFQKHRKLRALSAEEASEGICDKRTLSQFENGKKQLGYAAFLALAQKIYLPLEEIDSVAKNYQSDPNEQFFKNVHYYYHEKNIDQLKALLKEEKEATKSKIGNCLTILMLSAMIHDLDHNFPIPENVFQNASNYLFNTKQWSYYELSLFCNVAHVLKIDLSCTLMHNIINHKEIFCNTNDRKRLLIITLINVMYPCLQHDCFDDFNVFFELAYRLIVEKRHHYMREECTLDFLEGLYMFITGHQDDGRKAMSTVVNFLLLRNYDELGQQFQSYYEEALIKENQRQQEKRG